MFLCQEFPLILLVAARRGLMSTESERELSRLVRGLNSCPRGSHRSPHTSYSKKNASKKTELPQPNIYHLDLTVILELSIVFHIGYMHGIHEFFTLKR